jgi:hypothetical protein
MSLGIVILIIVLVLLVCVLAMLATGVLRVRVETHVRCAICGGEIPPGSYQRSLLWEQLRSQPDIGLLTHCEHCAAGYPVIGRPGAPGS